MLFQNVQNYYEKLIAEELSERDILAQSGQDYMEDITCLALNRLPPRYIRFEVDMGFYMDKEEYLQMRQQVSQAVDDAVAFIAEKQAG